MNTAPVNIDLKGRTPEAVFQELRAREVRRLWEVETCAANTGRLRAYWCLLLLPDELWHAARVWDAQRGSSWVLLSGERFAADGADDAVSQFQLATAEMNVRVGRELTETHPTNPYYRKYLATAEAQLRDLHDLRFRKN